MEDADCMGAILVPQSRYGGIRDFNGERRLDALSIQLPSASTGAVRRASVHQAESLRLSATPESD
jgi:hypothetical protein